MTYRGVIKGKTIVLDEEPGLAKMTPVLVEIRLVDEKEEEAIAERHRKLICNPHRGGKLLYKKREELYDRR